MAKSAYLMMVAIIIVFVACHKENRQVEHLMENGVEVIVNHPQPAKLKTFELDQEFVIDLSSKDLIDRGLAEPAGIDIDSVGNIFVWSQSSNQNYVFKFNSTGAFISSFGRTGQGPGEVRFPTSVGFDSNDELMVSDPLQAKLVFFDTNGTFLKQHILSKRLVTVLPLKNGNYFAGTQISNPSEAFNSIVYNIYDSGFNIISEVGRGKYYKPNAEKDFLAMNPTGFVCVSSSYVFFGDSDKGYEIECFDKSGKLKRIIRKDFISIRVSGKFKDALIEKYSKFPPEILNRVIYPDNLPPFQTGFTDEDGRLFIMTYEESAITGQYWHDVFNKEGIFIGRLSIGNYGTYGRSRGPLFTMFKGERIYHFRENLDGFRELVVCRMK